MSFLLCRAKGLEQNLIIYYAYHAIRAAIKNKIDGMISHSAGHIPIESTWASSSLKVAQNGELGFVFWIL